MPEAETCPGWFSFHPGRGPVAPTHRGRLGAANRSQRRWNGVGPVRSDPGDLFGGPWFNTKLTTPPVGRSWWGFWIHPLGTHHRPGIERNPLFRSPFFGKPIPTPLSFYIVCGMVLIHLSQDGAASCHWAATRLGGARARTRA